MLANAPAHRADHHAAPHWSKRSLRLVWRLLQWGLGLVFLAWALLLLAWALLHWAILPHIDEWRPRLEREASKSLGIQVRIGNIAVTSGGWIPALELREVQLLDPQGRQALLLPRVAAALSARSLLAFELRFEQLLIDSPQMEIRRDRSGRIFVAGLSVDDSGGQASTGLAEEWTDWFFKQREFAILNGRIRWVDDQREAPPLELSELKLVLRNGLRQHSIRLDATPPTAWGQRFSLQGKFNQSLLHRAGDWKFWSGQLYADLPRADLRELRRHIDLPFELSEGDGALRAWIDFKNGSPFSATVDMGLRAVKLRLGSKASELDLTNIEGRLQLQREPQRLTLQATQLGFVSGDGVTWPRSNWGVQLKMANAPKADLASTELGTVLGGEIKAERLDLALMAQIAERLPLGDAPRELLADLAPRGVLNELNASWEGSLDAPSSYRVKSRVEHLQIDAQTDVQAPHIGRPGLRGADLIVDATDKGGQLEVSMAEGSLDFPGLFEEPELPIGKASARLEWKIERPAGKTPGPAQYSLKLAELTLANADLQGSFDGSWHSGSSHGGSAKAPRTQFPGRLELNGHIKRVDAVRVQRYLPLVLGEHARGYVKDAVRGGEARDVSIKVRGDLADFPFDGGRAGQFRIATQTHDVTLAYVPPLLPSAAPPWPVLEHIEAGLVFDRGSMQIQNGRASVLGYPLSGINGGIKDMTHHQPVLEIDGGGSGQLAELLQFMRASPVDDWTGHALSAATATGNAGLKLSLQLPLAEIARSSVKGSVQLTGNDVRIRPDVPMLENARARVEFDRGGVNVQGGQARALGGDLAFEGGTQRDGSMRFSGAGIATAEALRRASELPLVPRLALVASGQAPYRLQLGFNHGQPDITVTSSLAGMALDLPAPLRKEADATLPLRVQLTPQNATRDELRVDAGNLLQLQYLRDTSGSDTPRVLRGAVAIQDKLPPLPESGVQMQATLGKIDLDAWRATAQRFGAGDPGADASNASAAVTSYVPSQVGLRAQSLQVGGRQLSKLVAGITRVSDNKGWRFNVDAEQLSGFIELRPAQGQQAASVTARLARLSLPKQEADSVTQMLDSQTGSVPSLDIVVEAFELRGKQLGRLEVEAQASDPAHDGRDWHLSKLRLVNPEAVLNAHGEWLKAEAGTSQRRTQLDWRLDVSDAGRLLEQLGQGQVLRGGKGALAGQIGWLGSPLSPDYASMTGELRVSLDAGQFLKAEPGVGRLLGVLSLQSLPRRFLLDFRDVFSEGFAFDGVSGDVTIAKGLASSSNLKMRAISAAVLVDGNADLAEETQNLRVLVVPEINAGGASLAYAIINPAVGLATFLAQLVLNKPMAAAGTREFHITGKWDDPKVEQVEHKLIESLGSAASAPKE